MKHTPGDWQVINDGETVVSVDDNGVSTICEIHNGVMGYKANAALIAAAPELLWELKALWAIFEEGAPWQDADRINALIAKAEARS